MSKISVIIPVYNGARFLPRCLESLQKQTFADWQAVLIDDGSVDDTGIIADKFAKSDNRITVVHKKNAGVSAARNDGIKLVNGQYIHFMDADDVIDKDYYEQMLKYANDADMICSGFVSNNKRFPDLRYKKMHVLKTLFGKLFWTQALLQSFVWRYLFKTDFIKKNDLIFDTNMISQEDAIFVLKAIRVSDKISIVPNVNYHYMFNEDSALNKPDKKHHEKLKKQYKIGKQFRKNFVRQNNVVMLWYLRKIIKLFF